MPQSRRLTLGVQQQKLAALLLAILFLKVVLSASRLAGLFGPQFGKVYVDFDAFQLIGRMVWDGNAACAYASHCLKPIQVADSGIASILMLWTYPPQFDLILAPLAILNKGLAYLILVGGPFTAYLWLLRRLAGQQAAAALILTAPTLAVCLIVGQNGFLTSSLVGVFALWSLSGRASAGLPLGLMVIKPHLAVGLVLSLLMRRGWAVMLIAALVTLASAGLTTLVLGPGIWGAFLAGVRESGDYLRDGRYPMYRMTSVYAALRSFGLPSGAAFAVHGTVTLAACAFIVRSALRAEPLRRQLGIAMICTLAISPYNYDYDLPILGMGAALLADDVMARASAREQLVLLALGWLAGGWWLFGLAIGQRPEAGERIATPAGLAYVLLVALTLRILSRAAHPADRRAPATGHLPSAIICP